jgi:hypothetical protein
METVTNSGFNDSEAKDDTVIPYAPSRALVVTTVTPEAKASGSLPEVVARAVDHLAIDF